MKSKIKLGKNEIRHIACKCHEILSSVSNRKDALEQIAGFVSSEIGEYFGPDIIDIPDEIFILFIELLDQILFEIVENDPGDGSIREYIINDLFLRISIFIEVIKDIELYKENYSKRVLVYEDTLIIKHFNMEEYVPELISEFAEQPNLQKPILKALLVFESEDLINFYYKIAKDEYCIEVKILALLGLKLYGSKFSNWHLLRSGLDELKYLENYIENFDTGIINKNNFPGDIYSLFFICNFIELNVEKLTQSSSAEWILNVLGTVINFNENIHSFLTEIYILVSNILIYFNQDKLELLLTETKNIQLFIEIIDFFPREYFDRIAIKLAHLGDKFISFVTSQIDADIINIQQNDSNIMNYILWQSKGVI